MCNNILNSVLRPFSKIKMALQLWEFLNHLLNCVGCFMHSCIEVTSIPDIFRQAWGRLKAYKRSVIIVWSRIVFNIYVMNNGRCKILLHVTALSMEKWQLLYGNLNRNFFWWTDLVFYDFVIYIYIYMLYAKY